jgi:3-phosphoshikimate 1-carboxyvinyltransferase
VHELKVPSAQVKSALQLAALFAEGETTIKGADGVRDHTDRLLAVMGPELAPYRITVPRDPSAAAFFQVAAALIKNSRITVTDLSLNPGRAGALDVLARAGAKVEIQQTVFDPAEPMGNVTVAHQKLKAFTVGAEEVPSLVDELPVLAVLATQAEGTTRITGAADLRVKECDRITAMTRALQSVGAHITEHPDGWTINGPTPLAGGTQENPVVVRTHDDHRVAMSMAVAALVTEGYVALDNDACVGISFPNFFVTLEALIG